MSEDNSRESDWPVISLEQMEKDPGIATRTAREHGAVRLIDNDGQPLGVVCVPRGERPEL